MPRSRSTYLRPLALAVIAAAAALAIPASASAWPASGTYQGTVGDDPHDDLALAVVGTRRVKRKLVHEISSLAATVGMDCTESFGDSIEDTTYTFNHLALTKVKSRFNFKLTGKAARGARTFTVRGSVVGQTVFGSFRVDERRRAGNQDGFGALNRRGKVRCTTDVQPFFLGLLPSDLLGGPVPFD